MPLAALRKLRLCFFLPKEVIHRLTRQYACSWYLRSHYERDRHASLLLGLDTGVDGGRSGTVNLGMTDQGKPQH